jgi:hypothetical protein
MNAPSPSPFFELADKIVTNLKNDAKVKLNTHGWQVILDYEIEHVIIHAHDDDAKVWRKWKVPFGYLNIDNTQKSFKKILINFYPLNMFVEFTDYQNRKNTLIG